MVYGPSAGVFRNVGSTDLKYPSTSLGSVVGLGEPQRRVEAEGKHRRRGNGITKDRVFAEHRGEDVEVIPMPGAHEAIHDFAVLFLQGTADRLRRCDVTHRDAGASHELLTAVTPQHRRIHWAATSDENN